MNTPMQRLSPGITSMIRLDHTHVMAVFHRYRTTTSSARKSALVRNAALALEVHAQLEEEIFYPALREVASDDEVLEKSKPEHDEMRRLIADLRAGNPGSPDFDRNFMALMRAVLHHVADEETVLLPLAERLLPDRLAELGMQMTKRRVQLIAPHAGELAVTSAQAFPMVAAMAGLMLTLVGAAAMRGRRRAPSIGRLPRLPFRMTP
jgi:hemerythrin superfamily protein